MESNKRKSARAPLVALALAAAGVAGATLIGRGQDSPWPPDAFAYDLAPLPEGLDSVSTLEEAALRLGACDEGCAEVVYVWSTRMPLSRSGIPEVERAARRVGAGLTLVSFEELEGFAEGDAVGGVEAMELAEAMLQAGALAHAPSLVIHTGAGLAGTAILGYKTREAYESMIAARLERGPAEPASADPPGALSLPSASAATTAVRDYLAVGVPGAYFRSVPGRNAVAYEAERRIYLLDLEDGRSRVAPGMIDFIPTPDGRLFVTPGPNSMGLAFFGADQVFEAAARGTPADARAVFVDAQMRDQYPSIGILGDEGVSVRYRVLTSWFEGLRYREYRVLFEESGTPSVEPLGPPVVPCRGMGLSTPIMSQDGLEVAARDEETGTTKIYRFLEEGGCETVADLGMATRKVAWHPDGRKLAFSTPRTGIGAAPGGEPGIFVYDRDGGRVTRVADSEGASRLAFPDFVGEDAVIFMIPGRTRAEQSLFRVVEPLP